MTLNILDPLVWRLFVDVLGCTLVWPSKLHTFRRTSFGCFNSRECSRGDLLVCVGYQDGQPYTLGCILV